MSYYKTNIKYQEILLTKKCGRRNMKDKKTPRIIKAGFNNCIWKRRLNFMGVSVLPVLF